MIILITFLGGHRFFSILLNTGSNSIPLDQQFILGYEYFYYAI